MKTFQGPRLQPEPGNRGGETGQGEIRQDPRERREPGAEGGKLGQEVRQAGQGDGQEAGEEVAWDEALGQGQQDPRGPHDPGGLLWEREVAHHGSKNSLQVRILFWDIHCIDISI